jgi:hypothetical protein
MILMAFPPSPIVSPCPHSGRYHRLDLQAREGWKDAAFIAGSSRPVRCGSFDTPTREVVMLTIHVALVADTDAVSAREITRVAAALDKQVMRDFGPLWGVLATVDADFSLEDVPVGYWPI